MENTYTFELNLLHQANKEEYKQVVVTSKHIEKCH